MEGVETFHAVVNSEPQTKCIEAKFSIRRKT